MFHVSINWLGRSSGFTWLTCMAACYTLSWRVQDGLTYMSGIWCQLSAGGWAQLEHLEHSGLSPRGLSSGLLYRVMVSEEHSKWAVPSHRT